MNIPNTLPQVLTPLRNLAPGTAFAYQGEYWMLTDYYHHGDRYVVLIVNVHTGVTQFMTTVATVVPLHVGFVPAQ